MIDFVSSEQAIEQLDNVLGWLERNNLALAAAHVSSAIDALRSKSAANGNGTGTH